MKYKEFNSLTSRGLILSKVSKKKYIDSCNFYARSFESMITYRPQFRQLKVIVEDLENITSGWTENGYGESHSLLNDAYLIRFASHLAELGSDLQSAQLRHCNHNQNFVLVCMFSF